MTQPLELSAPRTMYLLAIADDELVIGHRHSHWTGVAPSLEEDLAFSTIAQDEINHADVWYQLLTGSGADAPERAAIDRLGLGRQPDEYRHAVLCERPPVDFAATLARQFLYDHFDAVRLEMLTSSTDRDVAATARRLLHEERYHRLHADEWLRRLAVGGDEASKRMHDALQGSWQDALWLFEPPPGEEELCAGGFVPTATLELVSSWVHSITPVLDECGWTDIITGLETGPAGHRIPAGTFARPGGRSGEHTSDWTDDVWPEMTALYRSDPDAVW